MILEIENTGPETLQGAPVAVYASRVDNLSQDSILIPLMK